MYINIIFNTDEKFDNITKRDVSCINTADLSNRLDTLCAIISSYPVYDDTTKNEIKDEILNSSILSDCFINNVIDDIDIDNFYYYFKYVSENKCQFN